MKMILEALVGLYSDLRRLIIINSLDLVLTALNLQEIKTLAFKQKMCFECLPIIEPLSPIPPKVGVGLCGSVHIKRAPQICLWIHHAFLVPTHDTERVIVDFTECHLPPITCNPKKCRIDISVETKDGTVTTPIWNPSFPSLLFNFTPSKTKHSAKHKAKRKATRKCKKKAFFDIKIKYWPQLDKRKVVKHILTAKASSWDFGTPYDDIKLHLYSIEKPSLFCSSPVSP